MIPAPLLKLVCRSIWVLFLFAPTLKAQEIPPKVSRYHKALLKRPNSETLFARFFDTWLETGTIKELETFLSGPGHTAPADSILLGRFYLRQGDDGMAEEALLRAVNHGDATPVRKATALITLSEIMARQQNFQSALERLEQAAKLPVRADQLKNLGIRRGQLLLRLNQRDEGLDVWKELLKEHPEDQILREDVVSALSDAGLYDEAIEEQTALISQLEKKNDAYAATLAKIELGQIHRRSGNWRQASEVWQSALPATGQDTWIERELLGLIETSFRRSDNLKGLKETLENLINLEPKRLSLQIAQARVYADLREDAAALEQWKRILQLTPGDLELRLKYIHTLRDLDRPQDAAEQLEGLITQRPDDVELHFELAELHHISGNFDKAAESLLTYLKQSDGSEFPYLRVARKLDRYDLTSRAEEVFEQLVKKYPESRGASDAYAMFLYDNDRRGAAIERWRALGKSDDVQLVIRVSRQLANRFETTETYTLLKSRVDDFETNSSYLHELCLAAINAKKSEEAFPWALRCLELAETPNELDSAIDIALKMASHIDGGFEAAISKVEGSGNLSVQCYHALLNDASGDTEKAVQLLQGLSGTGESEESQFPLLILTKLYHRQNAWSLAAETLEVLVTKSPGGRKSSHIQDLILLYERAIKPVEALTWAREWKKIAPGNPQPWLREANMLEKAGKITEALQIMQEAGRRFEHDTTIQIQLSEIYAEAGYPLESERIIWKLYEDEEDEWNRQNWINELTKLAMTNHRTEQLITELQKRRNNNSKSLNPVLSLAEVYRLTNRDREYRETLLAASTLAPDNVYLTHRITDLDIEQGRYDEAASRLESIRSKDKSSRTINRIARLHVLTGNLDKALESISELPNGKKPAVDEITSMAITAMSVGEWEVAAKFLNAHLKDHPDIAAIHYLHALAHLEAGQKEQAEKSLFSLLQIEMPATPPTPSTHNAGPAASKWLSDLSSAGQYRANTSSGRIYHLFNESHNRAPTIPIPGDQAQLQAFALAHLHRLKSTDLQSPAFREQLRGAGVSASNIDLTIYHFYPDKMSALDILTNHPDNADIAYWALNRLVGNLAENRDHIIRALDLVASRISQESAASLAFRVGETNKAFEYMETMDSIPNSLIRTLIQNRTEENSDLISQKLEQWEPGVFHNNSYQALRSLLLHYGEAGETDRWIERVKREWLPRPDHQSSEWITRYLSYNLQQNHNQVLPSHLPGVNLLLFNLLFSIHEQLGIPLNIEKELDDLKPHLALQYALSIKLQKPDLIEKYRDQLEEDASTLPELFLLGHYYANADNKNGSAEKALSCFTRARLLPMDPAESTLIDWQLFQLANKSYADESIKSQGIEAALRLRIDPKLNQYLYEEVKESLKLWGLPEKVNRPPRIVAEASRIQNGLNQGQHQHRQLNRSPLSQANAIRIPDPQTLYRRVDQLLDAGKKDIATRVVSRQLPMLAGRVLTLRSHSQIDRFRNLKDRLRQAELIDTIIEETTPPPRSRRLDQARFAAVCEILGNSQLAADHYRPLLEQDPEDATLTLRLIDSLAEENIELAIQELKILAGPDNDLFKNTLVGQALSSITSKNRDNLSDYIEIAEGILSLLEGIETPTEPLVHQTIRTPDPFGGHPFTSNRFFSGPANILNRLSHAHREKGDRIPQLIRGTINYADPFASRPPEIKKVPPQHEALVKRQLDVYKKLAFRLIELDYGNETAYFQNLTLVCEPEELLSFAQLAVSRIAKRNINHSNWLHPGNYQHPLPWLIEYAFNNQKPDIAADQFTDLPDAEKYSAQCYFDLLFCEPALFNNQIETALGLDAEHGKPKPHWKLLQRVRDFRPELEGIFDPGPIALAMIDGEQIDSSASTACSRTAFEIIETKGSEALTVFLDRIGNRLYPEAGLYPVQSGTVQGTATSFPEAIVADYQNPRRTQRSRFFVNLLNQLASQPKSSFQTFEYIIDRDLGRIKEINSSPSPFLQNHSGEKGVTDFLEFYTHSGLGRPLETFKTLPLIHFNQNRTETNHSLVARRLNRFKTSFRNRNDTTRRMELIKQVAPDGNATFGQRLTAACLHANPDEALLDFFNDAIVEIQSLPDDKQNHICQLARDIINLNNYRKRLDSDRRATLQWISHRSGAADSAKLTLYATAGSLEEVGLTTNTGNFDRTFTTLIQNHLAYDWRQSFRAFENICALVENGITSGIIPPESRTFTSQTMDRSLNLNLPVESAAFTIALDNSERLHPVLYVRDIANALEKQIESIPAENTGERLRVLSDFFADLQGQIDIAKNDTRILIPILYNVFRSIRSEEQSPFKAWVQSREAQLEFPTLVSHAKIAIHLATNEIAPVEKELKAALTSTRRNDIAARIITAELLCDDIKELPEDIFALCQIALIDGWNSNCQVRSDQHYEIINRYRDINTEYPAEWEPIKQHLCETFHRIYIAEEGSATDKSPRYLSRNIPFNSSSLKQIFELQLQAKRFAEANQLLKKFEETLKSDTGDIFAISVRNRAHELAATQLRTNWNSILRNPSHRYRFDPVMGNALNEFIKHNENKEPWVAKVGELALIILSDPKSSEPRAEDWGKHTERIANVASKIKKADLPEGELQEMVLNFLIKYPSARAKIDPSMTEIAKNWTIQDLAREKNTTVRQQRAAILSNYFKGQLSQGNTTQLTEALLETRKITSESVRKDITSGIFKSIDYVIQEESDPAILKKLIPIQYEAINDEAYRIPATVVGNLISLHFKTDTVAGMKQRIDGLNLAPAAKLFTYYRKYHLSSGRKFYFSLPSPPLRHQFANAFFQPAYRSRHTASRIPRQHSAPDPYSNEVTPQFAPFYLFSSVILKSESIADTGIDKKEFREIAAKMLTVADDLETRRAIFDHATSLIRKEQQSDRGWIDTYWNGYSPATRMLMEYGQNTVQRDWSSLALIADILWNNPPRDFTYAYSHNYREQDRFNSLLENDLGLWRVETMLTSRISELAGELGDQKQWGDPVVLIPQFFESFEAIGNPLYINEFIAAARKIHRDTGNPIARDFATAGLICLAAYHHEHSGANPPPNPDEWRSRMDEALNDPGISLTARLGLARFLANRLQGNLPKNLILAIGRTLAEGLNSETFVNGNSASTMLGAFNRLEPDIEWQTIAADIIKGMWHKSRFDEEDSKHGRAFKASTETILGFLETILMLNDSKEEEKLFNKKYSQLKGSPRTFTLLVRYGKTDRAKSLFTENFTAWSLKDFENLYKVRYDYLLHDKISESLPKLADDDSSRFEARFFLEAAPDLPPHENHWEFFDPELKAKLGIESLPNRHDRMKALAKDCAEAQINFKKLSNPAFIFRHWDVAEAFADNFKTHFELDETSFREIITTVKSASDIPNLLTHHIAYGTAALYRGDSKPLLALITSIVDSRPVSTSVKDTFILLCLNSINTLVADKALEMNPDQLKAIERVYATLLQNKPTQKTGPSFSAGIYSQILVNALLDGGKSLAKWKEANPDVEKDFIYLLTQQRLSFPHIIAHALNLEVHGRQQVSDAKRWEVAKAFLSDKWLRKSYLNAKDAPMLLHLIQHNGLTPEQVAKYDSEIAQLWPHDGLAARELAEFYAKREKWDKAKHFSRMSIDQDEKSALHFTKVNHARIRLASLFLNSGDHSFARELIEGGENPTVFEPHWKEFRAELLEKLDP
ncbi:MAG: tetratricopeptide repeat protein [Verrucomicrobiales bacterium]|nr:tetratricopeptide repeat protein [Verrucomicrobiales bacterium]